ncbi:MAG TPA: MarR family transcriptional regulator [Candidatus Dormibacteraeota bacterium]|nr:MarR family transcriptional regulator [Candidatus Dormibacteraeota bacterium]
MARDRLIEQILHNLLVMGGDADRLAGAAADFNRLNRTDLRALEALREGGMTAGRLARTLRVTSGATTRVIDSLVAAGHVRREADPDDRRRVLVLLTPAAVLLVDRTWERLRADTRTALEGHSDAELQTIARFLGEVRSLVEAHMRRLAQRPD